ncbi:hypothetical protein [Stenotrophomonas sp. SORGH_AS_0321]|uniref:hypothetical protein n=1 Tax=Stenotrophomonas sp. SORGH_AS_0321 TaxID=3041787 RepID=UPI0028602ABE|nr:hypothetical protein [Stenotrophomonas sp. SORGH_AS_0321]MDR6093215.1 hypothetical protein [Stenotrophomonas sp. SORGH_AS_0321]
MPVLSYCRAVLLATLLPAAAQPLRGIINVVDEKLPAPWHGIARRRGGPGCTKTLAEAVNDRMQGPLGHAALVRAMIDLCRPEAGGAR